MKIENNFDEFANFVSNIKNITDVKISNTNHGDIIRFIATKHNRVFSGVIDIFDSNINKLYQAGSPTNVVKDTIVIDGPLFKLFDKDGNLHVFEYRRNVADEITIHLDYDYI